MNKRYCIGIDLGTSNSVIALCDSRDEERRVEVVPVTQVFSPGTIGERDLFPSALYLPHETEFPPHSLRLPWGEYEWVAGTFAREHGALVPDRLVSSAKSWLCNRHIDRKGAVLPWRSEAVSAKVSPFAASRVYLEHMRAAFEYTTAQQGRPLVLKDTQVVVTVPASFDEVARSLTHEAAAEAGLHDVVLIEEPQAAFYAWIGQSDGAWREQARPGDLVLVCDVGGGTADFSLIAIADVQGNLELRRISVGDHILLGGDNMDLALAYTLRAKLQSAGHKIDHWQLLSLVHACRIGKEQLFSDESLAEVPIAVAARGSSLFARALSTTLTREELTRVVVDGFIPLTAPTDLPQERLSAGLQEYGLNFAGDPALSKHLARFLQRSLNNVRADESLSALLKERFDSAGGGLLTPNAVLFNGGVFKARALRDRVLELLRAWAPGHSPRELAGAHYDLAVARGAALYAAIRVKGEGLRIRAGAARSYYLGLETTMPAIPGYEPPLNGLCMVPQGMEEGSELCVEGKEFGLVTGKPVQFRFFSSAARAADKIGDVIENADQDLEELSGLQITLPSAEGYEGEVVPVKLHSKITEIGMLELWMHHTRSDKKWKLEFNVRADNP